MKIVSASIRYKGNVYSGVNHMDVIDSMPIDPLEKVRLAGLRDTNWVAFGFTLENGEYVTRQQVADKLSLSASHEVIGKDYPV